MSKNSYHRALILLLFSFISGKSFSQTARGEIQRFTLLHDRIMVDRSLRYDPHSHFLNIDLVLSSGIRTLINDLSNTSESSDSAIQKQLDTLQLLGKNVNTEKYVDILVGAGIPLPDLKFGKHKFYSSLFYQFNAGVSLSFNNRASATNPVAQVYARKEIKKGLTTFYQPHRDWLYKFSLYQLTRADTSASKDAATLSQSGEFFNLDDLTRDQTGYAIDLAYLKRSRNGELLLSAEEVQILSTSDIESLYGAAPLLKTQYTWLRKTPTFKYEPFLGLHFRKWYPIQRGVYGGVHLRSIRDEIPFLFTFKASNQFLTLMPQFKVDWFHFVYSFKTPFRNPQDEVWVSSLHNIQIQFPFP